MRLSYVHKIVGANEYVTEDVHRPGEGRGRGEDREKEVVDLVMMNIEK